MDIIAQVSCVLAVWTRLVADDNARCHCSLAPPMTTSLNHLASVEDPPGCASLSRVPGSAIEKYNWKAISAKTTHQDGQNDSGRNHRCITRGRSSAETSHPGYSPVHQRRVSELLPRPPLESPCTYVRMTRRASPLSNQRDGIQRRTGLLA